MAELIVNNIEIKTGDIINVCALEDVTRVTPGRKDEVLNSARSYTIKGPNVDTVLRDTGSNANNYYGAWQRMITFKNETGLVALPSVDTIGTRPFDLYPPDSFWQVSVYEFDDETKIDLINASTGDRRTLTRDQLEGIRNIDVVKFASEEYRGDVTSAADVRNEWLGKLDRRHTKLDTANGKIAELEANLAKATDQISITAKQRSEAQVEVSELHAQIDGLNKKVGALEQWGRSMANVINVLASANAFLDKLVPFWHRNKANQNQEVVEARTFATENPHQAGFDPDATIRVNTLPGAQQRRDLGNPQKAL